MPQQPHKLPGACRSLEAEDPLPQGLQPRVLWNVRRFWAAPGAGLSSLFRKPHTSPSCSNSTSPSCSNLPLLGLRPDDDGRFLSQRRASVGLRHPSRNSTPFWHCGTVKGRAGPETVRFKKKFEAHCAILEIKRPASRQKCLRARATANSTGCPENRP